MQKGKSSRCFAWIKSLTVAALLVSCCLTTIPLSAQQGGYTFTRIAFLGDPAPGGGFFINDFEPWTMNNRGEVLVGADLAMTPGGDFIGEGIFVAASGLNRAISQIARVGQTAPGGGTFDQPFWGPTSINDNGDVAFAFQLTPLGSPAAVNAGLYRFSKSTGMVTLVMLPNVTPAPGGGVFRGGASSIINSRGDIVFSGIVPTANGIHIPSEDYTGLGGGIYRADMRGQILKVVAPGDQAAGGDTFDFAGEPWINDAGDVAFDAHRAGRECISPFGVPQAQALGCVEGVYLIKAGTGQVQLIARAGDPAPGGGVFRFASATVLNNPGDILFTGDLTPAPGALERLGLFLFSSGRITPVVRPGDPMPGGGKVRTVNSVPVASSHLNNRGDVAFGAILDTGDKVPDSGVYVWSGGSLSLVARTGTAIPGAGTIANVSAPVGAPGGPLPTIFAASNDRGQVGFEATLTDGRTVMVLATPK